MLAGLLHQSLDARVGLVEQAQTLDELGQVNRGERFEGDADDGSRLYDEESVSANVM